MADKETIAAILTVGMQIRAGELKPEPMGKPPVNLPQLVVRQYHDILRELKKIEKAARR